MQIVCDNLKVLIRGHFAHMLPVLATANTQQPGVIIFSSCGNACAVTFNVGSFGTHNAVQVKHVLQELNAIPNDGSRSALAQAATVLQKHLIIADAVR